MQERAGIVARDMMAPDLKTAKATHRVRDAVRTMLKFGISGMPVVDDDQRLIGMLTQRDCIRALIRAVEEGLPGSIVEDVMTKGDLLTVTPDTHLLGIAHLFLTNPIRFLPVIENDRLIGQVTRRDLLRSVLGVFDKAPDRETAVLYLSAVESSHTHVIRAPR